MEAPVITLVSGSVVISFTPPEKASHAAVFLFETNSEGAEEKRMIDAGTSELLPTGTVGRAMRLTFGENECKVKGLRADTKYTAAVSSREADEFAFGPESPRSLPKMFARCPPPAMPCVHPCNKKTARVFCSAPISSNAIKILFTSEAGDVSDEAELDRNGRLSWSITMKGIDLTVRYTVTAIALSCFGPSDPSPATTFCMADHVPITPCAPDVEVLGDSIVHVQYSVPEITNSHVQTEKALIRFESGGERLYVNRCTMELEPWDGTRTRCFLIPTAGRLKVKGLDPDTTFDVSVYAVNPCGMSSQSPKTTITTDKSEVEVTHVKSAEERDAELIKDALDVENVENEKAALPLKGHSGARKRAKTEAA
jgi:hypothetical protein